MTGAIIAALILLPPVAYAMDNGRTFREVAEFISTYGMDRGVILTKKFTFCPDKKWCFYKAI